MFRVACFCLAATLWLGIRTAEAQRLELIGSALWTGIRGVNVVGDHAYCTLRSGFQVWDVADPAHPEWVGQVLCDGAIGRPAIAGDYAYVAVEPDELLIIDISDPAAPLCVGLHHEPYLVWNTGLDVGVSGTTACLFSIEHGVVLLDVSDPARPLEAGRYHPPEAWPVAGAVVGTLAYAGVETMHGQELWVLDIQNPAAPVRLGQCALPGAVSGVSVQGDRVYVVGTGGGLRIVDVANPAAPVLRGSLSTIPLDLARVVVDGGYAYCGGGDFGSSLYVVDVTNSDQPALAATYPHPFRPQVLAGGQLYGYKHDGDDALQALSLADPLAPTLTVLVDCAAGIPEDLLVVDDYAYSLERIQQGGRLSVLDLLNPVRPVRAAMLDLEAAPMSMALYGSYLYVNSLTADYDYVVQIVDLANPLAPALAGQYAAGQDELLGVAVSGHYLFSGPRVLDISAPLNPQPVATLPGPFQGFALSTEGGELYVAALGDESGNGIAIFDVQDPLAPQFLSHYVTQIWRMDEVCEVVPRGDLIYIAYSGSGLEIVDVSSPANPQWVSRFRPDVEYTTDVALVGDLAFVGYLTGPLCVADLSQPGEPGFLAMDRPRRRSYQVCDYRGYACVANPYDFAICAYNPLPAAERPAPVAAELELAQNYPNPFNGRTELSFTLPRREDVTLDIYNLLGQRVAVLTDGLREAGEHRLAWDAEGMPSGLYYARLAAGTDERTVKMMLLK